MVRRNAAIVLCIGTAACSSLQPLREPAQYIATASPEVVYVTHRNRSLIVVAQPRISGDTVYGLWQGQTRPVALPLSQVQSVQARQRDGRRTAMLVAGLTILGGATAYAFLQTADGHNNWYCDYNTAVPRCGPA